MRDQGRLVEWFDDKGYGFIQPNDGLKERVFLHIKDFAQKGPRPIVGCALEYVVQLDGQGRYKAKQVTYLKATQTVHAKTNRTSQNKLNAQKASSLQPMQIICIVYIVVLAILSISGLLNGMILFFVSIINVMTYWFYSQDKEAAQMNQRRVPENTLHILAFLGGWPAAWLAQQRLRHKTQKQPFRKIYFCTIVFNILLILWLISPLNVFHI
ncbi:DUF1294 domain-containing protein [Acinetobacter bereziniae]|uniref:CSD domain-containing protein n=1 Tax=Acinetobacter bereziniae LMG 1003 = CIP 70.12 TaxID=981324 RepID=N9CXR2_ACIBZ|nr:DUF1294 domain-containing protein [Acinetobacter bereziniae]ENV90652.1 hypothetical protein F938_03903 [Acinetobacter bereziniae LMG 1003 = CIP 70.12]MBJ9907798.1 cold shock and DUF1294 domain-containing protein [Acinetobacter bereziniae]MBJ9929268.1 cold shock and DUF1294 domain-containing protein [Acinetobacter bereziniae]MDG3556516.1 DUF1294 domain-containing protein [Acinetobacter bereziniae]MDP6000884.1 DUF1294 domain-containing protein [Acinetobacter bereziniae]